MPNTVSSNTLSVNNNPSWAEIVAYCNWRMLVRTDVSHYDECDSPEECDLHTEHYEDTVELVEMILSVEPGCMYVEDDLMMYQYNTADEYKKAVVEWAETIAENELAV